MDCGEDITGRVAVVVRCDCYRNCRSVSQKRLSSFCLSFFFRPETKKVIRYIYNVKLSERPELFLAKGTSNRRRQILGAQEEQFLTSDCNVMWHSSSSGGPTFRLRYSDLNRQCEVIIRATTRFYIPYQLVTLSSVFEFVC